MIRESEIDNRQVTGGDEFEGARVKLGGKKPQAALSERIAAARALRPPAPAIEHCGHCWGEGRDAAIRAIESLGHEGLAQS